MRRGSRIQLGIGALLVLAGVAFMGWVFFTQDPRTSNITTYSAIALTPVALGVVLINIAFIKKNNQPD